MALNESLTQGLAAMQGRGVDPATLYGMSPAGMAPAPMAAPVPMPQAPPPPPVGAPMAAPAPDAASFYGVQSGGGPQAGAMPGAFSGAASSALPPHAVHPSVDVHAIADYLLPQVRNVESTNNYKADRSRTHPGQTASGAYQYIDSTWNGFGGFKRAVDAPPEVQDQRMKQDLLAHLDKFGGDPFKTVAAHYFPRYANDPSLWNKPLIDGHGKEIPNSQTVAQYVSSVLPKDRVASYMGQTL